MLLVRDPRGTLNSRHECGKRCEGKKTTTQKLCKELSEDYHDVQVIMQKYPNRVKVVRYEDLTSSPKEVTKDIFNFANLPFTPAVEKYLQEHTTTNDESDIFSTYRDSTSTSYQWMIELPFVEVS